MKNIFFSACFFLLAFGITACNKDQDGTIQTPKQKIRLLSIGNSYSQDALAYVPFIFQNMGADVDLHLGILMQSSSTASMHVDNFTNQTVAYTFNYYAGGGSWNNNSSKKTIQWALDNYEWDIIVLQGAPQSSIHASYYQTNMVLYNLVYSYVSEHGGYPIKFAWYQTIVRPAIANGSNSGVNSGVNRSEEEQLKMYQDGVVFAQEMMNNTDFKFLFPVGTAVRNARTNPALDILGDYSTHPNNSSEKGYFSAYDGVHLQEGLPCLTAAYTFCQKLSNEFNLGISILDDSTIPDASWASGKNIPGPHGKPIGLTKENIELVKRAVMAAIKNPYEITDMQH